MTIILGIDPGSRITGFGVIRMDGHRAVYIDSGCVRIADLELAERLRLIFAGISEIVRTHNPAQVAVEKVFMNRNADSAIKLGQARGAAIVAAANLGLPVFEYSPNQIKQAVAGRGHAEKEQIQQMVKTLLGLSAAPAPDAADALATAVCHGHMHQGLQAITHATGLRRGRWL